MGLPPGSVVMQEELPAAPASVGEARRFVRRFARGLDVDVDAVVLAVSEAVSNAVVHAYEDVDGKVEVLVSAAPYELRIIVRDNGRGIEAGGAGSGAGFGLSIIRRLARHVDVADTPDGVTLTMSFARGGRWSGS